jgi:hypothetical protein
MRLIVTRRGRGAATAILVGSLILSACAPKPLTQPSWPAPADPMALAAQAGLVPTEKEYLTTHTHAHLDVFVDGQAVQVPSGIGIDIESPSGLQTEPTDDGTGTQYFVTICPEPCLSPLHTHDPTGILHTESKDPDQEPDTLGQFFTEWGVRLDEACVGEFCTSDTSVAIYLDGDKYKGNPAEIKLESHLEIAIVIGKAPSLIPDSWNFLDLPQ